MVRKDGKKRRKGTTGGKVGCSFRTLKQGLYFICKCQGLRGTSSDVVMSEGKVLEVKVKLQIGEVASETVVVGRLGGGGNHIVPTAGDAPSVPQVMGRQHAAARSDNKGASGFLPASVL